MEQGSEYLKLVSHIGLQVVHSPHQRLLLLVYFIDAYLSSSKLTLNSSEVGKGDEGRRGRGGSRGGGGGSSSGSGGVPSRHIGGKGELRTVWIDMECET